MEVGFIGLGNIGNACALHLAESDFDLFVHDIDEEAGRNVVEAGASWRSCAREVAESKLTPLLARGRDPASDIFVISNPDAPTHRARDTLLDHFRQAARPT